MRATRAINRLNTTQNGQTQILKKNSGCRLQANSDQPSRGAPETV